MVMLFPLPGQAEVKAKMVVDEETASQKGVTLSTPRMDIGIPAGALNSEFKVKINEPNKKYKKRTKKKIISPVRLLNINCPDQPTLEKNITVSIKYKSKNKHKNKFIAYYDTVQQKWKKLQTTVDEENKIAYAETNLPYIRLAVLQSNKRGPKQEANFSNFHYNLDSPAAVVIDAKSGNVLFDKNKDQQRSIASLTKIMTAQIFLDSGKSMDDTFTYTSSCNRECVCLRVNDGETMSVRDIFYTMLIGSANNAAVSVAKSTGFSDGDFVAKMNAKAKEWNLSQTQFSEPSGLDANNKSTAYEYAKLAKSALKEEQIMKASTSKSYAFYTQNTGNYHNIINTNKLINRDLYLLGTKTGFTYEAMFCLMAKIRYGDEEVIVVVLGNPGYTDSANEVQDLANWAFANYDW